MANIRTLEGMITKFTDKMNPTRVGDRYQASATIAVNRYQEAMSPFVAIEERTRNILENVPVPAAQQGVYYAFSLKLTKYSLKHSGADLQSIANGLIQEYGSYGADPAVLTQLANLVLGSVNQA